MASGSSSTIRNLVIYEIYVRNHGSNGTFADVEADLERIRALGVDYIWFMPIHPIGKVNKKGTLGCPYSIADYREVNPEYGTKHDFSRLIDEAHQFGLKVMIDVVFNHTAHDSVLLKDHPDWYHQNSLGLPVTTVPDWSDVIDLKFPNPDLETYLIDTLKEWALFGVDGFRCDVASLVPLSFWEKARRSVSEVKPGILWLAESVHAAFIEDRRRHGLSAVSDGELYRAFDITYDYDIFALWQAVVTGRHPVSRYLELLRLQDTIYPANFAKLRFVENHDQPRILQLASSKNQALAWTAFQAFNRGPFLIYGGQEAASFHTPSLFEIDRVNWGNCELAGFLARLTGLKKDPAQKQGHFTILDDQPAVQAIWSLKDQNLYGIFNVSALRGKTQTILPDAEYTDLLTDCRVRVKAGEVDLPETAVILRVPGDFSSVHPFSTDLMDFRYE